MKALLKPTLVSLLLLCLLLLSGCPNVFSSSAAKTSDAALLYKAKRQIDTRDYQSALDTIATMTVAGQAGHEVVVASASAHAGLCGLEFIDLAQALADGLSTQTLMQVLLTTYKAKTSYAECSAAEQAMLSIASADRTSDDQVFLAFIEFAKIGTVLASVDKVDANDDGVGDTSPAFDPCDDDEAVAGISDLHVGEIGAGIMIATQAIAASGIEVAGSAITQVADMCTLLDGTNPPLPQLDCTKTSASEFTATELTALRMLINAEEVGLNMCGGAISDVPCICL